MYLSNLIILQNQRISPFDVVNTFTSRSELLWHVKIVDLSAEGALVFWEPWVHSHINQCHSVDSKKSVAKQSFQLRRWAARDNIGSRLEWDTKRMSTGFGFSTKRLCRLCGVEKVVYSPVEGVDVALQCRTSCCSARKAFRLFPTIIVHLQRSCIRFYF